MSQGQGSSAFREFIRGLPDAIARARELGMPIKVPDPGTDHARALLRTLGAEIDWTQRAEVLTLHDGDQVLIGVERTDAESRVAQALERARPGDELAAAARAWLNRKRAA